MDLAIILRRVRVCLTAIAVRLALGFCGGYLVLETVRFLTRG